MYSKKPDNDKHLPKKPSNELHEKYEASEKVPKKAFKNHKNMIFGSCTISWALEKLPRNPKKLELGSLSGFLGIQETSQAGQTEKKLGYHSRNQTEWLSVWCS